MSPEDKARFLTFIAARLPAVAEKVSVESVKLSDLAVSPEAVLAIIGGIIISEFNRD